MLWIAAYVTDVAAVNPNGIKTFLANGLSELSIKDNSVFSKILLFVVLYATEFFDNFILDDEPLQKLYDVLKLVH